MPGDGVAVDGELAAAVAGYVHGEAVNVAAASRRHGISRQTFYKYVARYAAEGVAGLFPRSRRPHHPPTVVGPELEDAIVRARKDLADQGWDNGAISIWYRLLDDGWAESQLASRATIHRVLVGRGMVVPAPRKRPRRAGRRFERDTANALWQIDGFETTLLDQTSVVVIQILDDHSRLDLACHAAASENGTAAWAAFTAAATGYGLPAQVLSDNGGAFSGKRRGWTAAFETALAELGVKTITSRSGHPQTCGKNERAHATLQQWLSRRPPPAALSELQTLLEDYRVGYNNRRHQGIGMLTPQQCYDLAERSGPDDQPLPAPLQVTHSTVTTSGSIGVAGTEIGLGRRHAGKPATAFTTGDDVTVFIDDHPARQLTLDRRRRYQPQDH